MANSDNCLKTADKPKKDGGKKAADKYYGRAKNYAGGNHRNAAVISAIRHLYRRSEGNRAQPILRVKVCANEGRSRKYPYCG